MLKEVTLHALYRAPAHAYKGRYGKGSLEIPMEECESFQLVAGSGIEGDRYFDHKPDFKGQITFFSQEVYEEVKQRFTLPELQASAFRRNAVISGVDLNALIGKDFTLHGVTYTGVEEAAPCLWMNEACADGVEEFLKGKGGLRCRIREDGELPLGGGLLQVTSES